MGGLICNPVLYLLYFSNGIVFATGEMGLQVYAKL